MTKINKTTTHFAGKASLLSTFSQDSSGCITKDAILMLEGTLPDSKGIKHTFTAERLTTIAENTNAALQEGVRLPVLLEHDKTALSTVGNANNAELFVKTVTQEDLNKINPKATSMLGKAALFVRNLVIQTPDVIEKVLEGTASSVSMGLDLLTESLKEISIVGIPAWDHATLYAKNTKTAKFSALTWDEDQEQEEELDEKKEQYEDLTEELWNYLRNIYTANEAELEGRDPNQLIDVTLYGFVERVKKLIDLDGQDQDSEATENASLNGIGVQLPAPMYSASKYSIVSFKKKLNNAGIADKLNKPAKTKKQTGIVLKGKKLKYALGGAV